MSPRDRWALWAPAVAVAIVGTALGVWQAPPGSEVIWDKFLHAGSYFVLGLLLLRATHGGFAPLRPGPGTLAVTLALAHGVAIEIIQGFVPWREASVGDAIADAVGALAAVIVVALWYVPRRAAAR